MPTYIYPFLFGALAVLVGFYMARHPGRGEADRLASRILFAVAAGCVVVGVATIWLWNHH